MLAKRRFRHGAGGQSATRWGNCLSLRHTSHIFCSQSHGSCQPTRLGTWLLFNLNAIPTCHTFPTHSPRIAHAAQVDEPANPHGLDHGWRWLSRALNSLPADRVCSKALSCFLRSGGYGLHRRFKGQFVKLLRWVQGMGASKPALPALKPGSMFSPHPLCG